MFVYRRNASKILPSLISPSPINTKVLLLFLIRLAKEIPALIENPCPGNQWKKELRV